MKMKKMSDSKKVECKEPPRMERRNKAPTTKGTSKKSTPKKY